MKVGIIILCRYSSSRLPGKILKTISSKEVLSYIVEKIEKVTNVDGFCIATSTAVTDNRIEEFCKRKNYKIFRGSLENVAERFLNCGDKNNYDVLIRINGDNIFLDVNLITQMIDVFKSNNLDFLSNVKGRTYPKGMSVEIVKKDIYQKYFNNFRNDKYYQEHVMPYFYDNDFNYKTQYWIHSNNEYENIDLALDTQDDFNLAQKIISKFNKPHYEYSCSEIVSIYKKENDK